MAKKIFLFPGQGSQSVGMGKDLHDKSEKVRKLFDDANSILGFDVRKYCFEGPIEELTRTHIVQPAITLVNICVLEALKESGIAPDAACGHSLGEYAAVYAAGVLDFESVMKLVKFRGKHMQDVADKNPGGMVAVIGVPAEKVKEICAEAGKAGTVGIANINTREQLIVSGVLAAIDKVAELAKGVETARVIPLKVSGPWHSPLMKEVQYLMAGEIHHYRFSEPKIPIVCNFTADYGKTAGDIRENLVRQVTGSVRWLETIERLSRDIPGASYIEAGPGRVLRGLVRSINRELEVSNVENCASLEALKKTCI